MSATGIGKCWAVVSFTASLATAVGYYFPYWIQGYLMAFEGRHFPMYFGIFRRCSYPHLRLDGSIEIMEGCGRYSTFMDIPSIWWQISTVAIGAGTCLAFLISLTGLIALCIRDIITIRIARAIGLAQMTAGLVIGGGVAVYPMGWGVAQVRQACGYKSDVYDLGDCTFDWAFYLTCAGGGLTLLCSTLTCHSFDHKHQYRLASRV